MFERLTRAVHQHASLAATSSADIGHAAFGQACLHPIGAEPTETPPVLRPSDKTLCASDIRLYADAPDQRAPGQTLVDANRAYRAKDIAAIDGDFAAALWDEDTCQLDLLRDAMGVRPLFFVYRPGVSVVFCSLIHPLLDSGAATRDPNPVAIARKSRLLSDCGTQTFLKQVQRVPAAHRLRITARGVEAQRYWAPGADRYTAIDDQSPATMAKRLRAEIDRAVRLRLPPSGDAATHCSGGLDSSTVAVLAATATDARNSRVLGCFFAAPSHQDVDAVDAVDASTHVQALKQRRPNLDIQRFDHQDLRTFLLGRQRADLPISAEIESNPWARSAEATGKAGIPVLLSGFGGDETASFKGQGGITGALLGLRFGSLRRLLIDEAKTTGRSRMRILGRELTARILPPFAKTWLRRVVGAAPDPDAILSQVLTHRARRWTKSPRKPWTIRGYRRHVLTDGRLASVAELLAIDAARYGVAVSFPYFDRRLIAFTLEISADLCWHGGQSRSIMRSATDGLLPEMIRTQAQKSADDGASVLRLVEMHSDLHAAVAGLDETAAAEVFDTQALTALVKTLPNPDEARIGARRLASEEGPRDPAPMLATVPFVLARFMAAKDR